MSSSTRTHIVKSGRVFIIFLAMGLLATACTEQDRVAQPEPEVPEPETVVRTVDLNEAIGGDQINAVGVTVEPNSGDLIVLDASSGIYRITDDKAELIWRTDTAEDYGVWLRSNFTDIVAIDDGVFALTAVSDGFLLDTHADTLQQHFCYEPGWNEEPPFEEPALQVTNAVAYDRETNQIVAQPQTILNNNFEDPQEALLSTYDRVSGVDLEWHTFEDRFYRAGAMALERSGLVLLGVNTEIHRYNMDTGELTPVLDLADLGVERIEGMTLTDDRLFVVDGATGQLLEIDRDQIEL